MVRRPGVIVVDDEKRGDFVDKLAFGKLWDLMGTFWPNSPRYQDRKANVAYWYALQPYRYEDARAAVVRHSRKQGSFWPDVANITGTLKPVEDDAADDEPEYSWDKPITADEERQMICLWARLHELPEPPEMDTAQEYLTWAGEQRAAMREEAYYADAG